MHSAHRGPRATSKGRKNNTFKVYTEAAQGLSSAQKTEEWETTGRVAAEVSLSGAGVAHHCVLRPGAVGLSLLLPSCVLTKPRKSAPTPHHMCASLSLLAASTVP